MIEVMCKRHKGHRIFPILRRLFARRKQKKLIVLTMNEYIPLLVGVGMTFPHAY
jgi:hypothetical protein